MRLKNRVAIITGASSGIGERTAELFVSEGAAVVIVARRKAKLDALAKKLRQQGGVVSVVAADITKQAACDDVVMQTIKQFGQVDILVNNAGIADKHMPINKCSTEWWNEVLLIDQTAVFYLTKAALQYMVEAKRGSIVNISSIGGVFGSAGIAYSAAKSAVIGMTKNIAIQFAGQGIRCNCVCPGPTPTELNLPEKLATFDMDFAQQCAKHMNMSLPETTVDDQAQAILFFASEEAKGVTGQILVVDNGITL